MRLMHPNRLLILLGGCLLMASAAFADDLGYVDCATHPEETQVFAKARKSQDVVGTVPCGERFKIVLYGFIFSEVQTGDGKVGFVFSSVITVDRNGGTLQTRAASDATPKLSAAADTTKIPADPKPAQPKRTGAAPPPAATTAPSAPASDAAANTGGATSVAAPAGQTAAADTQTEAEIRATAAAEARAMAAENHASAASAPKTAQPAAPASAPAAAMPTLPDSSTVLKATTSDATTSTQPTDAPAPAPTQPAAPDATNATSAASSAPAEAPVVPAAPTTQADTSATDGAASAAAQPIPEPSAAAQPAAAAQPQPVQPVQTTRKVKTESWEMPNPGARRYSLIELYGGFGYARMGNGSGYANATNFLGGVGAFGFNVKSWIQIAGDSSYNYYSSSLSGGSGTTSNVLYGNHYGPRFFWRRHNRFNLVPFGEALFGGTRLDTHWPAAGGYAAYTTSTNTFSWKVGGGVDMHSSGFFQVRLIDVDYYRTSFGTAQNQSNYWISTGVVFRLIRPRSE